MTMSRNCLKFWIIFTCCHIFSNSSKVIDSRINVCNSCSAEDRNCSRIVIVPCNGESNELDSQQAYRDKSYYYDRFTGWRRNRRRWKYDNHHYRINNYCEVEDIYACRYFKCYDVCCAGWKMDVKNESCTIYNGYPTTISCKNGGKEKMTPEGLVCVCPATFTGKNCETNLCNLQCQNEGLCDFVDGAARCICQRGFEGTLCEKPICPGQCLNGGRCVISVGIFAKPYCVCPEKYSGEFCEKSDYRPKPGVCPKIHNNLIVNVGICTNTCYDDNGCQADHKCCSTGCGTSCMKPADQFCVWNNTNFSIGTTFNPNRCTICTCYSPDESKPHGGSQCVPVPCPVLDCEVIEQGECCNVCLDNLLASQPETYEYPRFINCPSTTVVVILKLDESIADLPIQLIAKDYKNQRLHVIYSATEFHAGKRPNTFYTVTATSSPDSNGKNALCIFQLRVRDLQPPTFDYCPSTIKTSNQVVDWQEPIARDNVGLAFKPVSRNKPGEKFEYGEHAVIYKTEDYEGNVANCIFFIKVSLPSDNKSKTPEKLFTAPNIQMFIIGSSAFGVVTLIILILTMIWCKTRKPNNGGEVIPSRLSTLSSGRPSLENIYSVGEPPPAYECSSIRKPKLDEFEMVERQYLKPPAIKESSLDGEASSSSTCFSNIYTTPGRHATNPLYQDMIDQGFHPQ